MDQSLPVARKLDAREEHFQVPGPRPGLSLFLRYLPPVQDVKPHDVPVLYVHGGTFPSALSIAHRFDNRSWRDELRATGFHVWGLDFHGFGLSDPYPEMEEQAELSAPLGRATDCSRQLEHAVRFIRERQKSETFSLIAHSWGLIVAGRCPCLVDRMVFFGPITRREPVGDRLRLPGWRLISLQDQWHRFVADVPAGSAPVLSQRHFDEWGERYLDTDPKSRTRTPAAVKTPGGAFQDISDAWSGELVYDPARIHSPVGIIRGEWDGMCTDADARWLFDALSAAPLWRDVKISRATHLMHLKENRFALYREAECFLKGNDRPAG